MGKTGQGLEIVTIPSLWASGLLEKVKRLVDAYFEEYGEVDAKPCWYL